jgi:17beta-estradiol 17-dehydrogenase / very-long-chain 3-oxoacyl-CoA reductase
MLCCCLTTLGVVALLRFAVWVFEFVTGELPSITGKGKNVKSFGKWGAVTGCTSGIGEAYAHELARRGLNVVLIGRSKDQLDRVAKDIADKHKVSTKIVQVDLAKATKEDFARIVSEVKAVDDLGVFVNNAGLSYDHAEYFADVPIETHRNILEVNTRAVVELTYGILPIFVAKKKGALVNVSSITGVVPGPLLATYAASKAFVDSFTISLAAEYKSKGVTIQSLTPGFVVSKMSKIRKSSITTPSAEVFARSSVASLGAPSITGRVFPNPIHYLQTAAIRFLPESVQSRIVFAMHRDIRTRALKKRRQE